MATMVADCRHRKWGSPWELAKIKWIVQRH